MCVQLLILGIVIVGMVWRFVTAITEMKTSAIWYGIELLALGFFLKSLMI